MKTRLLLFPLLLAVIGLVVLSCNKEVLTGVSSDFIEVPEENKALYFYYYSTDDPNCGTIGYDSFVQDLNLYDTLQVMGAIALGDIGGANNDTVFTSHAAQFNIQTVPYFQANFQANNIVAGIDQIAGTPVVVNAAAELEFTANTIIINTTTQFFQDVAQENFYITPYVIVDSIVAAQEGHPDTPNTTHRKNVVDVGRIAGYDVQYLGYPITGGTVYDDYRFNLQFEVNRLPSWTNEDLISVALVITQRDDQGNLIYVNSNTSTTP